MSYQQGYGNGNGGVYGNGSYGNGGGGGYGNGNGNGGYGGGGYNNGGYGNNGYGNSNNSNSYGNGGYGNNNAYGRAPEMESGMEMNNNPQNGYSSYQQPPAQDSYGQPAQNGSSRNDNDILDQCLAIDQAITELETRLSAFTALQTRVLSDRASYNDLDASSADIMSGYRALAQRMKKIKSKPESGTPRNSPQVGRIDRRLKKSMMDFQKVEAEFRARIKEQQARQYLIVKPDASEAEVAEAVDSPDAQIFQQALINSDRRGQSQTALSAVRQRHAAIQNIERTMIELAELFQDLDTLIMEQDVAVKQIEEKGEQVQEDVTRANEELDKGISSARAARRKKWCLFWFVVILLLLVAVAVVIYIEINKKK